MCLHPKPLISEEQIRAKVAELGAQISHDYAGRDLTALCILKGAWVFFADLVRAITLPMECDFVAISSYGSGTTSSGEIQMRSELPINLSGRDVLIVEDIADTGLTLLKLQQMLSAAGARDVRICVLLDKPERREVAIELDYVGFTVPNRFVVGYGIDYNERYRNLPYIAYVEEENDDARTEARS